METHRFRGSRKSSGSITSALAVLGVLLLTYEVYKLGSAIRTSRSYYQQTGQIPGGLTALSGSARRSSSGNRRQLDVGTHQSHHFPASRLKTLVLVACHSVYTGLDFAHSEDQSSWFLLDYQKEVPGQTHSFVEHIKLGITQAASDPDAMLLFSGGKTRKDAGPRAEAMGYWLVAEANKWYGHEGVRNRAYTEEHARDSFENFLFGLCRFYELAGHYPSSVVVVGYEFKRDRFGDLHRAALRWPMQSFNYVGTPALSAGAEKGEAETVGAFEKDPYGCLSPLAEKRATRDPFNDGGYSLDRCPEMAELLQHCGPEIYRGPLPWDGSQSAAGVGAQGKAAVALA